MEATSAINTIKKAMLAPLHSFDHSVLKRIYYWAQQKKLTKPQWRLFIESCKQVVQQTLQDPLHSDIDTS